MLALIPDFARAMTESNRRAAASVDAEIQRAEGLRERVEKLGLTAGLETLRRRMAREAGAATRDIIAEAQEVKELWSSAVESLGGGLPAVKQQGGRRWAGPGERPTVPQFQLSKGSLIVTAALELSSNQVTHFYSTGKNTEEMVKLLDLLLEQYRGCSKLFLSWDAAGWHASKRFLARVDEVNSHQYRLAHGTPRIGLAPLPARAQFLNVIESVFNGLAGSVIHNSDYSSVDEAKAAIDRYFAERNAFFRENPKRAGGKIWGKERVPNAFREGQNCKNPRYR